MIHNLYWVIKKISSFFNHAWFYIIIFFIFIPSTPAIAQTNTNTNLNINQNHPIQKTEKISFNFQDIEVRAALQILADFSGFDIIVNDNVTGNITLRLQNIPWQEALEIILSSKGLGKRQMGSVILVGLRTEIESQAVSEMESLNRVSNLEPLKTEYIQIKYAKADKIAALLKERQNSLLSERGRVTFDERTNILLIQDIGTKVGEIKSLMKRLDIPVRQVEIDTQIVEANDSMQEIFGVRIEGRDHHGQTQEHLLSDLGFVPQNSSSSIGKLGFCLARLPRNTLIELELQALELESKIKTLSRPKLITTDKNKASVEQGFDIPYQEAAASGATSTSFRKAVLKLEVIPQITPDNKVLLDLVINNDSPDNVHTFEQGGSFSSTIKTSRLSTQVLAENGETIVLGGVLTLTDSKTHSKIPHLGDIPLMGLLFKNKDTKQTCSEVLIFITPRILEGT